MPTEPTDTPDELPAYWQDGRDISRELSAFIELVVRRMDREAGAVAVPCCPAPAGFKCGSCGGYFKEIPYRYDGGFALCSECDVVFGHEDDSPPQALGDPRGEIRRLRAVEVEYDRQGRALDAMGHDMEALISENERLKIEIEAKDWEVIRLTDAMKQIARRDHAAHDFPSNPPDPLPVEPDGGEAQVTPCGHGQKFRTDCDECRKRFADGLKDREPTPCLDECRARFSKPFDTPFVVSHATGCPNA